MSQGVGQRNTDADPAWPIWVIVCLYALCAMTNVRDLFALPWMIGRDDVIVWWVTGGYWALGGGIVLFLSGILITAVYSHMREPLGRKWAIVAFGVAALGCLLLAGRGRVEVRAEDLRIEFEGLAGLAAVYRVEQATALYVSCETGSKSKIYPGFEVEFADGAYMNLTPLVTPQGNPFGARNGLAMAERFDGFLSARGARHELYLAELCVRRTVRKMGGAAPRVEQLFRGDWRRY